MAWIISSWIPGLGLVIGTLSFWAGLVYPTYESMKAIESKGTGDDTQWLTYWVCVCTLQVVEKLAWTVLSWVPLYSILRLVFLAWMVHPATKGATYLYEEVIRPLLMVTANTLKDIPVLQPLVADFTPAAGRVYAKAAPPAHMEPTPDLDALKAEAVQRVQETFEKAKQQQPQEEAGTGYYQPLKQHAT